MRAHDYLCMHHQASAAAETAEPAVSPEEVAMREARAQEAATETVGMRKVFDAAADSADAVLRAVARDEEQSLRDAYSSAAGGKRYPSIYTSLFHQHDYIAHTCNC